MMKKFFYGALALPAFLMAGPYAPSDNIAGTEAISFTSDRVMRWATAVEQYSPGEEVDLRWQDTDQALGPAGTSALDVVSLGRGGEIILEFDPPIQDVIGDDFAVFENSFNRTFLELAFVEVSSDGVHFFRFQNDSQTEMATSSSVDATNIAGLAGKYRGSFGTPFDLFDLRDEPELDRAAVRFVRLIDVVGGTSLDSSGEVIYDPFPTFGSAGFDLDGIAVLSAEKPVSARLVAGADTGLELQWNSQEGVDYLIQYTPTLNNDWNTLAQIRANDIISAQEVVTDGVPQRFYRISRKKRDLITHSVARERTLGVLSRAGNNNARSLRNGGT